MHFLGHSEKYCICFKNQPTNKQKTPKPPPHQKVLQQISCVPLPPLQPFKKKKTRGIYSKLNKKGGGREINWQNWYFFKLESSLKLFCYEFSSLTSFSFCYKVVKKDISESPALLWSCILNWRVLNLGCFYLKHYLAKLYISSGEKL